MKMLEANELNLVSGGLNVEHILTKGALYGAAAGTIGGFAFGAWVAGEIVFAGATMGVGCLGGAALGLILSTPVAAIIGEVSA